MIWNLKTLALIAIPISLAGSAWYGYNSGRQSGMSQIQTQWDAERLAIQAAQAEQMMKAAQREKALQALLAKQRKEHKYESDRLAIQYESALSRLSDRPDRPDSGGVPEDPSVGTGPAGGCTGAQLYRPDAEVLIGLARDADQLRLALRACIAHATEVERELNRTAAAPDSPEK
jgi:hypothetical protein